jgi:hypothetical protein
MLADYLRCARPGTSMLPIAFRAVIHNHWKYHPKLRRVVYLMRDGRDVVVSYYFFRVRALERSDSTGHDESVRLFREVYGSSFDAHDTGGNLPAWIEYQFKHPTGAGRYSWADHIKMWVSKTKPRPNVLYMTYEELLQDTDGALAKCLRHIDGHEPDARLVARSAEHFSMKSMTGREPGKEDRGSFIRKGVAGDWLGHFTREAAEAFDRHAGDALVLAGYEPDRDWVDRYEYPSS